MQTVRVGRRQAAGASDLFAGQRKSGIPTRTRRRWSSVRSALATRAWTRVAGARERYGRRWGRGAFCCSRASRTPACRHGKALQRARPGAAGGSVTRRCRKRSLHLVRLSSGSGVGRLTEKGPFSHSGRKRSHESLEWRGGRTPCRISVAFSITSKRFHS